MDFTELFVAVDDFWLAFRPEYERHLLTDGRRHRRREGQLSVSEIMTILIAFQTSNFRDFKHFYAYVCLQHRPDFPNLVSYSRFVSWIPRVTEPLALLSLWRDSRVGERKRLFAIPAGGAVGGVPGPGGRRFSRILPQGRLDAGIGCGVYCGPGSATPGKDSTACTCTPPTPCLPGGSSPTART